jgi:hypothetical protein
MERIPGKIESSELVIRNLDTCWVGMAILDSSHHYPFFGRGMRDELKNDLKRGEVFGIRVLRLPSM